MRYLFLLIILYLCFNFVTLGQEVNIEFEKSHIGWKTLIRKEVLMISYGDLKRKIGRIGILYWC